MIELKIDEMTLRILSFAPVAFLGVGIPTAKAVPACIYQDAALRAGPGNGYYLVGTIPAPARVILVQRRARWSLISYDGETGAMSRPRISRRGAARDPTCRPPFPRSRRAAL